MPIRRSELAQKKKQADEKEDYVSLNLPKRKNKNRLTSQARIQFLTNASEKVISYKIDAKIR